jgi:methyl-accepting chemotaxis protein
MNTRSWTIGQQVAAGLVVPLVMLVLLGVVSFRSTTALVATNHRVQETYEILAALAELRAGFRDAELGERDFLVTGADDRLEPYRAATRSLDAAYADLRGRAGGDPVLVERIDRLRPAIAALVAELDEAVDLRRREGLEAALRAGRAGAMGRIHAIDAEIEGEALGLLKLREAEVSDREHGLSATLLGGIVAAIALSVGVALTTVRGTGRRIGSAIQHMQSSAAELQAAATQQATGAREQAIASDEVSTTIAELLSTSRQITESTRRVTQVTSDTAAAAHAGDETVQRAQAAIDTVQRQVEQIVVHMLDLGRKSQQVGGIVDIINELAEQTNILAINATIEAVGAGDAGRRFSVVADEIRKLADRVGGSTREIRALIEDIRSAANTTVMATESGSKAVEGGTKQFGEVASSFRRITDLVGTTAQASREIELSTKQQATAVEQVNAAILEVARTAKETESSSTQTLQTSSELARLAHELGRLIQRADPA